MLMRTYHTTREVYKTKLAWTTVKMRPGTRPSTEYEYGKDMMARQMYSAKSSAAVYTKSVSQSVSWVEWAETIMIGPNFFFKSYSTD